MIDTLPYAPLALYSHYEQESLSPAGYEILGMFLSKFTLLMSALSFSGPNDISHCMCNVHPLLELSCTEATLNEAVLHAVCGIGHCLFTVISYVCIIQVTLQICSAEGRHKAFSTCTSHLIIIIMDYRMVLFNYNRPHLGYSLSIDILVSPLYCIVMAMLDSIIYSLWNHEVKAALGKIVNGKHSSQWTWDTQAGNGSESSKMAVHWQIPWEAVPGIQNSSTLFLALPMANCTTLEKITEHLCLTGHKRLWASVSQAVKQG